MLSRGIEENLLDASERNGLSQIVFSPLAQGALTGKYSGGKFPERSRASDPKRNRWMGDRLDAKRLAHIDQLKPFAAELGVSMAQLALAWCLRRPAIASVIVGATRLEQLEENVKAVGVLIPSEIETSIDELFPSQSDDD